MQSVYILGLFSLKPRTARIISFEFSVISQNMAVELFWDLNYLFCFFLIKTLSSLIASRWSKSKAITVTGRGGFSSVQLFVQVRPVAASVHPECISNHPTMDHAVISECNLPYFRDMPIQTVFHWHIERSVENTEIYPKFRKSVIAMSTIMACFTITGVSAVSYKRVRTEENWGGVEPPTKFSKGGIGAWQDLKF